jgi:hypothetical protein
MVLMDNKNFIKHEIRIPKDMINNIQELFGPLDARTITAVKIDIDKLNDNALVIADDNKNVLILIGNLIKEKELDVLLIHELIHVTQDNFYKELKPLGSEEFITELKTYIDTVYYSLNYDLNLLPTALIKGVSGVGSYLSYYIIGE